MLNNKHQELLSQREALISELNSHFENSQFWQTLQTGALTASIDIPIKWYMLQFKVQAYLIPDFMPSELQSFPNITHSDIEDEFSDQFSESMLSCMVAIGAQYWPHILPDFMPSELQSFPNITHSEFVMSARPCDLFVEPNR